MDQTSRSAAGISQSSFANGFNPAIIPTGDNTMKDVVLTEKGPKPIGPYSQAVKSGGFLFASGQVALDPRTNDFLSGDIRQQTERVLENIKGILEAGGVNLHHVVKTTVFLKDMNDFAA